MFFLQKIIQSLFSFLCFFQFCVSFFFIIFTRKVMDYIIINIHICIVYCPRELYVSSLCFYTEIIIYLHANQLYDNCLYDNWVVFLIHLFTHLLFLNWNRYIAAIISNWDIFNLKLICVSFIIKILNTFITNDVWILFLIQFKSFFL